MLGENIRNLRKENKMSQEALAEKLGVSRQSISLWENGQTQPTLENIIAIADVFKVTTDDIIKDNNIEAPQTITEDIGVEVPHTKKHFWKFKYIYLWIFIAILIFPLIIYIIGNRENKIETLSNSVLMLNIYNKKDELIATGSGFVAFEDDILVTNYHVIEDAYKIEAVDEADITYSFDKIIAYDKEKDLALLGFGRHTFLKTLKLYDSSKLSKGDEVIAIGSPIGLKNTVSKGIISSIRKEDENTEILQITAPISPGSSGGVLLNKKGKVIGVTFAGIDDGQNINFAIPSNEVSNLYKYKPSEITIQEFFSKMHKEQSEEKDIITTITVKDIFLYDYDLAKDLSQRIKNGEDFNTLMHKYTEDKNELGIAKHPYGRKLTSSENPSEYSKVAFSLKVGEISDVVTSYISGSDIAVYHIIQRIK